MKFIKSEDLSINVFSEHPKFKQSADLTQYDYVSEKQQ